MPLAMPMSASSPTTMPQNAVRLGEPPDRPGAVDDAERAEAEDRDDLHDDERAVRRPQPAEVAEPQPRAHDARAGDDEEADDRDRRVPLDDDAIAPASRRAVRRGRRARRRRRPYAGTSRPTRCRGSRCRRHGRAARSRRARPHRARRLRRGTRGRSRRRRRRPRRRRARRPRAGPARASVPERYCQKPALNVSSSRSGAPMASAYPRSAESTPASVHTTAPMPASRRTRSNEGVLTGRAKSASTREPSVAAAAAFTRKLAIGAP